MARYEVIPFLSNIANEKLKNRRDYKERKRKFIALINRLRNWVEEHGIIETQGNIERIGDFKIYPQTRTAERISWYAYIQKDKNDKEFIVLKISDLHYHINESEYEGNWTAKVVAGKINKNYYESKGYIPYL